MEVESEWYELWTDETLTPPYVLILLYSEKIGYQIFDPVESREKPIHTCATYEDAKIWMLEDEYEQIGERKQTNEIGW